MGKIFYIMGKSASGKDTIYKELMEKMPKFHSIVPYTTRPMREGEKDGVEYFFVDQERFDEMMDEEKNHRVSFLQYKVWNLDLFYSRRWTD